MGPTAEGLLSHARKCNNILKNNMLGVLRKRDVSTLCFRKTISVQGASQSSQTNEKAAVVSEPEHDVLHKESRNHDSEKWPHILEVKLKESCE